MFCSPQYSLNDWVIKIKKKWRKNFHFPFGLSEMCFYIVSWQMFVMVLFLTICTIYVSGSKSVIREVAWATLLLHFCAGSLRHLSCRFGSSAMIVELTRKFSSTLLLINAPTASPTTLVRPEADKLQSFRRLATVRTSCRKACLRSLVK